MKESRHISKGHWTPLRLVLLVVAESLWILLWIILGGTRLGSAVALGANLILVTIWAFRYRARSRDNQARMNPTGD